MNSPKKLFVLGSLSVLLCFAFFMAWQRDSAEQSENRKSTAAGQSFNDSKRGHQLKPQAIAVKAPSAPSIISPKTNDRFPGSVVLDTRDGIPDANGRFTRLQLLRTQMKYPLIRVEQTLEMDPATHAEKLIHQTEMVADHVVVELIKGKTEADLVQALEEVGGTIRRKLNLDYSSTYLIALPKATLDAVPDAAAKLSQFKSVLNFSEPDFLSHKTAVPNDPQLDSQWHLENTGQTGGLVDADIDAEQAWSIQTGNNSVVIAISDTGIDFNHTDLQPNIWTNPNDAPNSQDDDSNGYVDDVAGWNFAYADNTPIDDEGHGTFVAGVIGAVGNNAKGIAGVCWQCKLMPLKVLDNFGSGYTSDIAEGFAYAQNKEAKIINASHAGPGSTSLKNAVNNLQTNGVLLVAAADNDARNEDAWKDYPASYTNQNIICVSASDKNDHIAYFANYGPTTVDLFAPGDDIWSTQRGNGYGLDSGTSFATPQVAAVAGLLKAQNPTWTTDNIKQAILQSVDLNPLMIGKCVSGGRLNAYRALAGIYNNSPGGIDVQFDPKWTVVGSVLTMAVQDDGKLLLGGAFTNTGIHNIARLNADGIVDPNFKTGVGANGPVYAVALQTDGKILIGGAFTKFNGVVRNRIARLNSNGTLDTTFLPGMGADANVNALLIEPDGKILIGGAFNTVNGTAHPNVARLNLNGSVDSTFNAPAVDAVQCLALQSDTKILFGGATIGRLNSDGSSDNSFSAGFGVDGLIRTLAVDGNGLIAIGGDFTTYNGNARAHIARLLTNGTLDDSFATGNGVVGTGVTVKSIVFEDDCTILLGGSFTNFDGNTRPGIARLDSSGSIDPNFNPSVVSAFPGVNAIAPFNDGRVYLGGSFTSYGRFARRYVVRIIGRDLNLGTNSFSLSSTNLLVNSGGGNQSIAVSTFGCASWRTFTGTNSWVSVVSGAVGLGSGDAVLFIAPNTNSFARSTTAIIGGKKVTITQSSAFTPSTFSGKTLLMNERLFVTFPATNTFVSRIADQETFGTFVYTIINPTNASLTITDDQGTATIYLYFTSPTGGTYTNTRGSSGVFTLYSTRPDFNGDGRADLLWVNATNAVRAWFMSGTNTLGTNRVAITKKQTTAWKLVVANDFNLDGQPDLLWQNSLGNLSIWLMNQTNYVKTVAFRTSGAYKVIGMSDLNLDGKKDLVFETGTGYLLAWFLNGTNRLGQVRLNRAKPVPVSLKAVGFDDFDHDGQADLLWQGTNNVLSVWSMTGTNFTSTNVLNGGVPISGDWRAVGINDFNYDGNPDVLFENAAGDLWIWLLNGFDVVDSFYVQPAEAVDPKWRVIGPK